MFREETCVEPTANNAQSFNLYNDLVEIEDSIRDLELDYGVSLPRGLLGAVALHIYRNSTQLMPMEYLIPATYGFAAGLCGLKFKTPDGEGTNLYMVAVGLSGTGKSHIKTGMVNILGELCHGDGAMQSSNARRLVDIDELSHGNVFFKKFERMPSMCWINGEFGNDFAEMKNGRSPKATIYNKIVKLWDASNEGAGSVSITYTDNDKDIEIEGGVGLTIVGESVKESVYENISLADHTNGFLSRFMLSHYSGDVPPTNRDKGYKFPSAVAFHLRQMVCAIATEYSTKQITKRPRVKWDKELTYQLREEYRLIANKYIANNDVFGFAQNNRKASKILKFASLEAAFTNWVDPEITPEMIARAKSIVDWFDRNLQNEIQKGELDDNSGVVSLISKAANSYLMDGPKSYLNSCKSLPKEVIVQMRTDRVVPEIFFNQRYKQNAQLKAHGKGNIDTGIEKALAAASRAGVLQKIAQGPTSELKYPFTGALWRIVGEVG